MSKKTFISYSWDDEQHKSWVSALATRLRADGVDVTIDQWEIVPGDQLPSFMEIALRENELVLIICTPLYKAKSDDRKGGVGYEGDIMTAEVLAKRNHRKFVPILRAGEALAAIPTWLDGKWHVNLSGDPYSEDEYQNIVGVALGTLPEKPPLGKVNASAEAMSHVERLPEPVETAGFTPVSIIGVDFPNVGTPTMDGTRGCALYRVPILLSHDPGFEWHSVLEQAWKNPPSYAPMHRIKSFETSGRTVVIGKTTLEEVRDYHRVTLKLCVQKANDVYQMILDDKQEAEMMESDRIESHKEQIEKLKDDLKDGW